MIQDLVFFLVGCFCLFGCSFGGVVVCFVDVV